MTAVAPPRHFNGERMTVAEEPGSGNRSGNRRPAFRGFARSTTPVRGAAARGLRLAWTRGHLGRGDWEDAPPGIWEDWGFSVLGSHG